MMKRNICSVCVSIVLGLLLGASTGRAQSARDSVPSFPALSAENLLGREFILPRDFEGTLNVVLIAFARGQQADVDGWMPALKRLAQEHSGVRIYEFPVLARRYRMIRSMIDGGMRRGIQDSLAKASTFTLYIDKTPFRTALDIPDEGRIYLFVLDKAGRIRGRTSGPYAPDSAAVIAHALGAP